MSISRQYGKNPHPFGVINTPTYSAEVSPYVTEEPKNFKNTPSPLNAEV